MRNFPIYEYRTLGGYVHLITWLDIDYGRRGARSWLPIASWEE